MTTKFDELSKALASGVPRREALRVISGLLGGVLAAIGLEETRAAPPECVDICRKFQGLSQASCFRACGQCRQDVSRLCLAFTQVICCAPGSRCCHPSNPSVPYYPTATCCPGELACCRNTCCAPGEACCCGPSGLFCGSAGPDCVQCPVGTMCRGGKCCSPEQICVNTCCAPGETCCCGPLIFGCGIAGPGCVPCPAPAPDVD